MGMGFCKRRYLFLTICILQVLSTVERQIFDFLGYMWAPILANFLHVIFVIFGFFGAYQYRSKYIATYVVWDVLWIGWNIFIICFYLDVGILDKNSDILNLGTGSFSWWEVNGIGCKPVYPTNLTSEGPDPFKPLRPEKVLNCVLDYQYVEILHASFQLLLAVFGIMGAILLSHIFVEEDDSFDFLGGFDGKSPQHMALHPMYVNTDYVLKAIDCTNNASSALTYANSWRSKTLQSRSTIHIPDRHSVHYYAKKRPKSTGIF